MLDAFVRVIVTGTCPGLGAVPKSPEKVGDPVVMTVADDVIDEAANIC